MAQYQVKFLGLVSGSEVIKMYDNILASIAIKHGRNYRSMCSHGCAHLYELLPGGEKEPITRSQPEVVAERIKSVCENMLR